MSDEEHEEIKTKPSFKRSLAQVYEYYLSGPIGAADQYVDWFDEIRRANPDDEIRIYINSTGGSVDTALQFLRVLSETPAPVTCSVEGSCMSAATMIFLSADVFEITPHSLFMFHNYSGGIFGKGGEIYDQAVFERAWSTNLLRAIYKDFLIEAEITSLLDNKDLWLHSEDVASRCAKLLEIRQAESEDVQQPE